MNSDLKVRTKEYALSLIRLSLNCRRERKRRSWNVSSCDPRGIASQIEGWLYQRDRGLTAGVRGERILVRIAQRFRIRPCRKISFNQEGNWKESLLALF